MSAPQEFPLAAILANLREAQTTMDRRQFIRAEIARLQAEDSQLAQVISNTWSARMQQMFTVVQAYVQQVQSEVPPEDTPAEEEVP